MSPPQSSPKFPKFLKVLFQRFQAWLESIEVRHSRRAHWLCRWIPAQCPFERDVKIGPWQFHIPALCHLNPFYEQLMVLRFRALCFLADECGEDISQYC
ncbi:Mo-dependent nitrogenase C-terminal domain-containing protein [Thermosynechococcaceae cyanobacterium BACA0444]|uniref:Mo-dependent nitrogenase C-terminal domain-containing protein n=1 Tax=Pseudocalidococcus azoricus BACA0444 TaxID=2918990 RepID=A0AAE4FPR5_9CYAN|nr:Mo-dependent nitrogenase C-terminal domain-containing protein [Pseudocalidococcus azoricus]MDS3860028.1 Mo-dependent nitrogenase C-terminal domain-containing protein [Pseudocalidococcus azoricus BACA0444]